MTYDIRRPKDRDRGSINILLRSDYAQSGYPDKKPLTDVQFESWKNLAVVAFRDEVPEAIVLSKPWKYGDAAPYSRMPMRVLKGFAKAGLLYQGETGVFVMSAKQYEEDTALSALVDETGVLEPKTGAVHVPLLLKEREARLFLENRGFRAGRTGWDTLDGEPVEAVLMTRKK